MEPGEREDSRDGDQDEDSLIAFYYRMAYQRNDPRYEARFHELADDDFPNGLERVELGGFPPSAPTDGVQVLRTRSQADRLGFRAGDIIVALDGYRVRSLRQYVVVNRFSDTPETRFIVFRHPAYVELRARSASRLYGLDLRSHRSPTRRQ
jgi:S1-C subfamily serine protease